MFSCSQNKKIPKYVLYKKKRQCYCGNNLNEMLSNMWGWAGELGLSVAKTAYEFRSEMFGWRET